MLSGTYHFQAVYHGNEMAFVGVRIDPTGKIHASVVHRAMSDVRSKDEAPGSVRTVGEETELDAARQLIQLLSH